MVAWLSWATFTKITTMSILSIVGIVVASSVGTIVVQILWAESYAGRRSKPYKNKAKILLPCNK